jgi:hypothetical protein
MFIRSIKLGALALGGITLLAFGAVRDAKAADIELLSVTPEGSLFEFNYSLTLAQSEALRTGDFFTIYDFNGFAGFSSPTFGTNRGGLLTGSSSLVGPNAPGVIPAESVAIPNVTFTYSGPDLVGAGVTGFSALSTFGGTEMGSFTSQTTDVGGTFTGQKIGSIGPVRRPAASAQPIPEPSSVALAGLGLLGAVGMVCRRRKAT